jgi:hypothetical protein
LNAGDPAAAFGALDLFKNVIVWPEKDIAHLAPACDISIVTQSAGSVFPQRQGLDIPGGCGSFTPPPAGCLTILIMSTGAIHTSDISRFACRTAQDECQRDEEWRRHHDPMLLR